MGELLIDNFSGSILGPTLGIMAVLFVYRFLF